MVNRLKYINTNIRKDGVELKDNKLILSFEEAVTPEWLEIFRRGSFEHKLLLGYDTNQWVENSRSLNDIYSISCRNVRGEHMAEQLIEHVLSWIPIVNAEYNNFVDNENAKIEEEISEEEKRKNEEKEINKRLNDKFNKLL